MCHFTKISWDGIWGISPIRAARESLAITVASERHSASVFGAGGVPRGFLRVKGITSPEAKANIREAWELIHGGPENGNKIGILGADTEFVATNMTPEDQQLLASRSFQIDEIARIFGVPTNLLFKEGQSYNADEQANTQFYQLGLRSLIENVEAELSFRLLSEEERHLGYHVKYDVERLLRGNFTELTNNWSRLVLTSICTRNEARERLGLNPIEGGDVLLTPSNVVTSLTDDPTEKEVTNVGFNALRLEPPVPQLVDEAHERKARAAAKVALEDQIARAIRRQTKSRQSRERFTSYVAEAIGPVLRSYQLFADDSTSVEVFAERFADHLDGKEAGGVTTAEILGLLGDL